jgi:hypothetical protein
MPIDSGYEKIDFRNIDDQLLSTFLLILDESSVTKAAERLEATQSSVNHSLGKLRSFLGDPLFIRSGQAMLPAGPLDVPELLTSIHFGFAMNSKQTFAARTTKVALRQGVAAGSGLITSVIQ